MLTDAQIFAKYGKPGDASNIITIPLPFPMRLAWDPHVVVTKISCHKLIAPNLTAALAEILDQYGHDRIKELGIDLYGGCVNVRLMRGSKTKWSRHSWGIAIDLSPALNGLKTPWKKAQFSKPEYTSMVNIFYKHGFFNLGKEKNYDSMHFEISS